MKITPALSGKPYTIKSVEKPKPKPTTSKVINLLQDRFLKEVLGKVVTVKTVDGDSVTGQLKFFDKYYIRIDYSDRLKSLIYKSAICRVDIEE